MVKKYSLFALILTSPLAQAEWMQPMLDVSCVDDVGYFSIKPHHISAPDHLWDYGDPSIAEDNKIRDEKRSLLLAEGVILPNSAPYICGDYTLVFDRGITLTYKENKILDNLELNSHVRLENVSHILQVIAITSNYEFLTIELWDYQSEINESFYRNATGIANKFNLLTTEIMAGFGRNTSIR